MEVRTILWPTDLSKNSIKAAKHVSSLANKYQAKVILLYVGVDLLSISRLTASPAGIKWSIFTNGKYSRPKSIWKRYVSKN